MREDILQALSELIKEKTELKTEKVELSIKDLKSTTKELKKLLAELEKFSKLQTKVKSDMLPAIKLINKIKQQAIQLGIKFKDIPALVEAEKVYWPLNKLAKQLNII
jgi:septation ring formation regulator EzrA